MIRRLWHVIGGSSLPILALFLSQKWLLILISIATAPSLIMDIVRFFVPWVNLWLFQHLLGVFKGKESSQLNGSTYLLLAALLCFLVFEKHIAIVSLLFSALGDPLAAVVGERFSRRKVFGRGIEGSLSCFLICFAVGVVLNSLGFSIDLLIISAGATIAAVVSILPLPIDDNFTIPVFSGGVMTLIGFI